jgi:hypothetical protein
MTEAEKYAAARRTLVEFEAGYDWPTHCGISDMLLMLRIMEAACIPAPTGASVSIASDIWWEWGAGDYATVVHHHDHAYHWYAEDSVGDTVITDFGKSPPPEFLQFLRDRGPASSGEDM